MPDTIESCPGVGQALSTVLVRILKFLLLLKFLSWISVAFNQKGLRHVDELYGIRPGPPEVGPGGNYLP